MGDIRCTGGNGDGALWRLRSLRTFGLLFRPSIYRHSGPFGPVAIGIRAASDAHPVHPVYPGPPASDAEPQQEVWRKGLEDLNVYRTAAAKRRKGP